MRLGEALKKARAELFSNYSRSNSEKILILLSEGSSRDDFALPSKELNQNGVGVSEFTNYKDIMQK